MLGAQEFERAEPGAEGGGLCDAFGQKALEQQRVGSRAVGDVAGRFVCKEFSRKGLRISLEDDLLRLGEDAAQAFACHGRVRKFALVVVQRAAGKAGQGKARWLVCALLLQSERDSSGAPRLP